jgi:tetratricopeptide (TPR) repeat protein
MTPYTNSREALEARVRALEAALSESGSRGAYAPLAEAYRLSGRAADALATARKGLEAHPDHVGIRVVLARALADGGDTESALVCYQEVLDRDPDNVEARSYIDEVTTAERGGARREAASGREPDGAGDVIAQAVPRSGSKVVPDAVRSGRTGAPGSLSEELAHLADLFAPSAGPLSGEDRESEPSNIATLTLAEIYSRQGLFDRAAEVCERILERDPDNRDALKALDDYRGRLAAVEDERG